MGLTPINFLSADYVLCARHKTFFAVITFHSLGNVFAASLLPFISVASFFQAANNVRADAAEPFPFMRPGTFWLKRGSARNHKGPSDRDLHLWHNGHTTNLSSEIIFLIISYIEVFSLLLPKGKNRQKLFFARLKYSNVYMVHFYVVS